MLSGVDAAERAADLEARIAVGELSFAEAASQFSECPSKGKGGDLGIFSSFGKIAFLPYEDLDVAAFDAHCFAESTPIGAVSIVSTSIGTHLVQVEAR